MGAHYQRALSVYLEKDLNSMKSLVIIQQIMRGEATEICGKADEF